MKASVIDLRYRMNEVIKALERKEEVTILYRGKEKGRIVPAGGVSAGKVSEHPFFGMNRATEVPVDEIVDKLREARRDDL